MLLWTNHPPSRAYCNLNGFGSAATAGRVSGIRTLQLVARMHPEEIESKKYIGLPIAIRP